MQSLRQSRHLLSAVKAQVERDQDRARLRTLNAEDSEPATATAALSGKNADPEKAAQDAEPRRHRRPSAESTPRPSLSSSSTNSDQASDQLSNTAQRVPTAATQYTARAALGHSLTGVHARDRRTHEGKGSKVFVVGWEGPDDPLNPRNWTVSSDWSGFGPRGGYASIIFMGYLIAFVRVFCAKGHRRVMSHATGTQYPSTPLQFFIKSGSRSR
jgi:hypothetical protein